MGGDFCKKVDLSPQNETKLMLDFFLFFTYLGGGRTHPTHPPAYEPAVSCFSKIQIGFSFLAPAHLGSSGKMAINVCVCVLH